MSKEKIPNPWYVGVVSGMASYIDSAAIISNGTALVIYQKTIGITAVEIGILSGLLTLAIALGAFSGGRLGDRLGRRKVFIFTMLMIVMGTLLLAFGLNFPLLLLGTLLVGLATGPIFRFRSRQFLRPPMMKIAEKLLACLICCGPWELASRSQFHPS